MSSQDLTTLSGLKSWLGLPSAASPNDATLSALITAASRSIYAALGRPALLPQSYQETCDGDRRRLFLRHWPVIKVTTVALDGISIPAMSPTGAASGFGYLLRPGDLAPPGAPQALDLFGCDISARRQNLVISYNAGYAVQAELQTAPASSPWTLTAQAPYGPWAADLGVVYSATNVALKTVPTAPNAGQYSVSAGVYTFNASEAGASLSFSYGYIPQDLAQAALELAAERFRASERIGLRSKAMGGQETISYDVVAMSASVMAMLQPYRRVAA